MNERIFVQTRRALCFGVLMLLGGCSDALDCLEDSAAFVTWSAHSLNRQIKVERVPERMIYLESQLTRKPDKKSDQLQFEVFFYTNNEESAEQLMRHLVQKGYAVGLGETLNHTDWNDSEWLYTVQGSSPNIKIDHDSLVAWVQEMCDIGYEYDAKFEDWYFGGAH